MFLGTMFAPIVDRGVAHGQGFTHRSGDIVRVYTEKLGVLENKVTTCDQAPPWSFGIADLMRNLVRSRPAELLNGITNVNDTKTAFHYIDGQWNLARLHSESQSVRHARRDCAQSPGR